MKRLILLAALILLSISSAYAIHPTDEEVLDLLHTRPLPARVFIESGGFDPMKIQAVTFEREVDDGAFFLVFTDTAKDKMVGGVIVLKEK